MIYTHLPSNVFLILIALTDSPTMSVTLLLLYLCISQVNVPARQTFVTLLVSPNGRSAANGITNIVRSVGLSVGLGLNYLLIGNNLKDFGYSKPFLLAGTIKIAYDITLGWLYLWKQKGVKLPQFEMASMESGEI